MKCRQAKDGETLRKLLLLRQSWFSFYKFVHLLIFLKLLWGFSWFDSFLEIKIHKTNIIDTFSQSASSCCWTEMILCGSPDHLLLIFLNFHSLRGFLSAPASSSFFHWGFGPGFNLSHLFYVLIILSLFSFISLSLSYTNFCSLLSPEMTFFFTTWVLSCSSSPHNKQTPKPQGAYYNF